jgi:hypothetical protein
MRCALLIGPRSLMACLFPTSVYIDRFVTAVPYVILSGAAHEQVSGWTHKQDAQTTKLPHGYWIKHGISKVSHGKIGIYKLTSMCPWCLLYYTPRVAPLGRSAGGRGSILHVPMPLAVKDFV